MNFSVFKSIIFMMFLIPVTLIFGCSSAQKAAEPCDQEFKSVNINLSKYMSQENRPEQSKDIALALAISGGGHRAANFGVGIMIGLEEIGLLKEVDYISTVSGGGFAAGAYMTSLIQHVKDNKLDRNLYSFKKVIYNRDDVTFLRNLERSYTSALFWGLLNPINWFSSRDRGDVLEKKIDNRVLCYDQRGKSLLLEDVFIPVEQSGTVDKKIIVPYWIPNATIYGNGAIFPFTPDTIKDYKISEYVHRYWSEKTLSNEYKFPYALAVKASANFPIAVPATSLKCNCYINKDNDFSYLQLLDGGLTDNTGASTALQLLKKDKSKKKYLIVVDAFNGDTSPYVTEGGAPNEFATAIRIMNIGVDSNRNKIRNMIKKHNYNENNYCYFDLDSLKKSDVDKIRKAVDAIVKEYGYDDVIANPDRDPRKVNTDFACTRYEQLLLIEAGRYLVRNNKNKLLKFNQ